MRAVSLLSFVVIGIVLGSSGNAHALPIMPNATLPDGSPGFSLLGAETSLPAVQLPAVQFLVGFNAVHPPSPNAPTLDLADVGSPLINNPDTGSAFSIFWGMKNPGPNGLPSVQFTLPTDPDTGLLYPPSPCLLDLTGNSSCYDFSAVDGNNNTFDISFTISGPTAIDPTSWVLTQPGPGQFSAIQFDFDFQAAGDPTFSFNVTENGAPLAFSVPEPSTLFLMSSGIIVLLTNRHTRRRAVRAKG